ncbi:MAG: AMP-binding protein [Minwuia sp.]|uniref:AMP-binding protein n=1 Tax=Minwuia sp. TaxID=2493630 RepID=UPI003A864B40
MTDYRQFCADFDPAVLAQTLHGDLGQDINACIECCDRHVGEDRVALNWEGEDGSSRSLTFEDLQKRSAQVANLLVRFGVQPGDRVSGLLPRIPELVAFILGAWRCGAVYQPLFTAFGPKAIEHRLTSSDAKVVITDIANRPKLDGLDVTTMITTVGGHGDEIDFNLLADNESDTFAPVMRQGDDGMLMMATSGTTGLPKLLQIPLRALLAFDIYMRHVLEVRDDDVFWNIADPGWAYGLYYAVTGPLLIGHQTTLYDGGFTVESTARVVEKLKVTNFAGAPTAYRMLIAAGPAASKPLADNLRVASSAGEPLNPEVMRWFRDHIGCNLYDQYGQTECGMVLANHHGLKHPVREGSAGLPMPGFRLGVVTEQGEPVKQGDQGILAVHRPDSPMFFFDGYLGREGQDWVGDWYLTGDTVEENADGSISFVGRSDDVITSSGYRIGPFDVESALLEHDAVAESAVVGKPDPERGEIVKAFVILQPGYDGNDDLAEELRQHVRTRLGKHAFPREVAFPDALPKTPSGKIQRFILRKE